MRNLKSINCPAPEILSIQNTVESGFSKQLFSKYSGFSKYFSADGFFTT